MKVFNWKEKINKQELKEVKKIIEDDGIVIFPTETVYGIAASALSKKAVDKLYCAKKRPREKAINIMVSKKEDILKYASLNNNIEKGIIENFMPGEITIILEKKEGFGDTFTLSDNTVGVRIPNNDIALAILREINIPLIVSSANISGMDSGVNPEDIKNYFSESVDVLIDGGIIEKGIPSTIVKVENGKVNVLRKGKIGKNQIENSLKKY